MEEARIALNDGEYEKARSILEDMDLNRTNVRSYLSNALSGMAGLAAYFFRSDRMVGTILDEDGDGNFSSDDLNNKIELFSDAISAMLGTYVKDKGAATGIVMALDVDLENLVSELEDLTSDMNVQLGLLGLNHAVLTIARIIMDELDITTITLTESWIKANIPVSSVWVLSDPKGTLSRLLQDISIDLNLLENSVNEITKLIGIDSEDSNDLKENFEEFLDELDADGNRTLTKTELEAYLNSL